MNIFPLVEKAFALTEEELQGSNVKLGDALTKVYKYGIEVGIALAILVVIYAGYVYTTSQGNPDSIKTAKDLIIGALIGLALIILAGVFMRNFLGMQ